MKLNRFFMLGLAGLAFAACSNEEELGNQLPEGNGVVTVKIVTPESLTKAMPTELPDGSGNGPIKVVGDITIALDATVGGTTHTLTQEEIANGATTVKFWNVQNPTKVRVYMNGAPTDGNYSEKSILDYQVVPASIAAYGEAVPTLTSNTEKPVADTDAVKNEGNNPEDANKNYQMYTANVTMEIPVARLEVSGIAHKTHQDPEKCEYSELTISGIYLDHIQAVANSSFGDYKFIGDAKGTGADAILAYSVTPTDFMADGAVWPSDGKVYGFNFYPGLTLENNPVLKIYFSHAKEATGAEPKSEPRYAMITKYVASGGDADSEGIVLQRGKVYRITNAILDDKNIIGDEGGNTLYGVTVVVTEANWTVETIDAIWKE